MSEQQKPKLFREKSLEAVESPESLNDYLRVTSPGVWLVLAAVITLLIGAILWGIFGHIRTTAQVAVAIGKEQSVCYVPYESMDGVMRIGVVNVEDKDYPLDTNANITMTMIPEDAPNRLLRAAGLKTGDLVGLVPVETDLAEGYYSGVVVTEDLQPIALLLQ